jgi:hypothetical protein
MGLPPHFLGIHPDGNPASADAIRAGYEEVIARARRTHINFGEAHEETMRVALLIRDGSLPDGASRIETDWRDPAPQTLAGTSDAITKQIASGAIPATSDVTLKRLGYSAVERARLEQDRKVDQGASMLQQIAHSMEAKALRTAKSVTADQTQMTTPSPAVVGPSPALMPKKVPVGVPGNG